MVVGAAELETRHSELTLRRNDIFLASKHLYSLRCVFLDGPPRLLFDTGSSWLVFTDDKVELGAFPDGIVAARGVIYARTHSMDVPESVPEALPTWIEQALQEDEAALEAALRPIDLTLELPFAPAQTDDGEAVPIILDEVEDPKVELPDSEEKP